MQDSESGPWWKGARGERLVVAQVALFALAYLPRTAGVLPNGAPPPRSRHRARARDLRSRWRAVSCRVAAPRPNLTPLPYPKPLRARRTRCLCNCRHPIYSGLDHRRGARGGRRRTGGAALAGFFDVKSRLEAAGREVPRVPRVPAAGEEADPLGVLTSARRTALALLVAFALTVPGRRAATTGCRETSARFSRQQHYRSLRRLRHAVELWGTVFIELPFRPGSTAVPRSRRSARDVVVGEQLAEVARQPVVTGYAAGRCGYGKHRKRRRADESRCGAWASVHPRDQLLHPQPVRGVAGELLGEPALLETRLHVEERRTGQAPTRGSASRGPTGRTRTPPTISPL